MTLKLFSLFFLFYRSFFECIGRSAIQGINWQCPDFLDLYFYLFYFFIYFYFYYFFCGYAWNFFFFEKLVSYQKKGDLLLLVWHWFRPLGPFLGDTAHVFPLYGSMFAFYFGAIHQGVCCQIAAGNCLLCTCCQRPRCILHTESVLDMVYIQSKQKVSWRLSTDFLWAL